MTETKIWIYGVDENDDVVRTLWRYNHVSDAHLDTIAKFWKAECGCARVFAMMDSKELRDAWLVYIKTKHMRNGLADFAKFEFIDYLESGDWELAK